MKSLKFRLVTAMASVALVGLLGVPYSFSQDLVLKADVPFNFYVNGKLMPAGTYRLKPMSPGNWVINIADETGNAVMVATIPTGNRKPEVSRLVFNRYGSLNFLSQLYWEGSSSGHALPTSTAEREAIASTSPIKVTVASKE